MFSFSSAAAKNFASTTVSTPITITVRNLAGKTVSFDVSTGTTIEQLKNMVKHENLVDENIDNDNIILFKAIQKNNGVVTKKLDVEGTSLGYYYIENGDELHVITKEQEYMYNPSSLSERNNVMGGKRSRRKSHRRRKSRGKKSRKH